MMPACSPQETPGCACRRQGSSDVRVDILIELDQAHPTCKLDSALAKVAGFERGTRPGAVAAVYDYIRKHGLQVRGSQAQMLQSGTNAAVRHAHSRAGSICATADLLRSIYARVADSLNRNGLVGAA